LDKVLYISKRYRQIEFTFGIKKEITWILKDDEERDKVYDEMVKYYSAELGKNEKRNIEE